MMSKYFLTDILLLKKAACGGLEKLLPKPKEAAL
jgi:hypothetical protein